jgi:hypothetical protein
LRGSLLIGLDHGSNFIFIVVIVHENVVAVTAALVLLLARCSSRRTSLVKGPLLSDSLSTPLAFEISNSKVKTESFLLLTFFGLLLLLLLSLVVPSTSASAAV